MKKNGIGNLLAPGAAALMIAAGTGPAWAVTMPYSEDFNDGTASDFDDSPGSGTSNGTWSVGHNATFGSDAYNYTINSSGTGRSLVSVDGAPESGFVLTTDFVINSAPTGSDGFWTAAAGYYLFGSGGSTETAGSYIVDVQYANPTTNTGDQARMRIHDLGGSGSLAVGDFGDGSVLDVGTIYTMTVTGDYDGVNLDLSFTLTDGTTTTTISGTDTSPSLADNVVLRHFAGGSLNSTNVSYDNFNIAVPEPASLALFGLGGLLMFARRRRAA
ncbi:MAG: PEP-CTERM sorting domain-containing protein [Phycisphaeraceae bacterium]